MNDTLAIPEFSRFNRLMIAVALRELSDHQGDHVRGLVEQVERLAVKCGIDPDLWARADAWIAEVRRNAAAAAGVSR